MSRPALGLARRPLRLSLKWAKASRAAVTQRQIPTTVRLLKADSTLSLKQNPTMATGIHERSILQTYQKSESILNVKKLLQRRANMGHSTTIVLHTVAA